MPMAFKLDHLQPIKPILFSKFYNFFTFILGAISYYPRGLILKKGKFSQSQKWTRQRGLSAWGIQIGPVAACQANFIFQIYNFFTFIQGANSYYPRGLIMGKGNSPNSRNGLDRGVWVPGAFKLDHLQPIKPILFSKFYNFFTFILGAISYYPRGPILRKGRFANSKSE